MAKMMVMMKKTSSSQVFLVFVPLLQNRESWWQRWWWWWRKLRPPRSSWSSSPPFLTGMYLSRTVDISLEHHDNHAWLKIISIIDIVMTSDLLLPLLHWTRSLQDFFRPHPCHLVILYLPVCFNLYTDALLHHHHCYHQHIHIMCTLLYSLSSVHVGISFWGQTPL